MDTLSLILDEMRLQGAISAIVHLRAPWSLRLQTPGLAAYHVVIAGSTFLLREGQEPLRLHAGDLVIIPSGKAHVLQDEPTARLHGADLRAAIEQMGDEAVCFGADPPDTQLVSGYFRFDVGRAAPLVAALPDVIHISQSQGHFRSWLSIGIQFLNQELSARRPAHQAILNRVADIMLMECLREYVESLPEGSTNWLAALKDPAVSAALGAMHREPGRAWTVPDLAAVACLSRSAFAERFTAMLGQPPLTYLTQHRMRLAAWQLRHTALTVARIAEQVGYTSETSFSQAFKREHGVSPSQFRASA